MNDVKTKEDLPTIRLEELPVSGIGKIRYAGKDMWVMRIHPVYDSAGCDVPAAVDLMTGGVYKGDWPVYAVAPKGSSFTLVVN